MPTLAQIQEQQRKAGTTVSGPAPVNARAAQTASKNQNTNAKTKGISVGDNPNADLVERMVQVNFDPSKATPEEIARHEEGMRLAQGDQYVAAPGTNPAKGTMTPQQQAYANKEAGLDTSFTSQTGASIYDQQGTTQAVGQGDLEQSAIDNMRRQGMSDEEIRQNLSDPERMKSIMTTMSNTGLGGTDRQSAVLTPAQAQNILATSRNPKQRAAAQKFLNDQVSGVKGYTPRTSTDANGVTTTTYSLDPQATEMEQRRERERLALEESNRLKSQANADALKKFTAGIDTTQLDQTKTQIDSLMASIANLSPDLQAAVLPSLISLQQSNNDITKQVNEMLAVQPTDEEIESQYGSVEKYILDQDAKYKDLLARNLETSKEVATYNRDSLEIEKKIIDHDAAVAEQKQMIANAEGEKKLRRQLNRLGIQTDLSGLTYLQSEIQKGVDALENLKTGNNLVSLKAQLAIGEGYRLEVKQAVEAYEANYLTITSQTTDKLQSIKNSINTAKADRNNDIIAARKWGLEQKQKNDLAIGETINKAFMSMIESKEKVATQDRLDKRADDRLEFQERMANNRLKYSEDRADERATRAEVNDETKEAKQVRSSFTTAEDQPEVKNYVTIRDAYAKAKATLDAATAGGKKIDIGVAKEIATVLHEKALDPSSVVREGEYLRASKGQGWYDNLLLFSKAVQNGDTTGITAESAQAFVDAMSIATNTQRASALSRYTSSLNYLKDFNTRSAYVNVDPRTVAIPPELLRPEDLTSFDADSASTYDYNYGTYNDGMDNGTYEEDPKVTSSIIQSMPESGLTMDQIVGDWNGLQLLSTPQSITIQNEKGSVGSILSKLAPVTQGYYTPISTKNYQQSTVTAWGGHHAGLDLAFAGGTFMPSVTDGTLKSIEYSKGGWGLTAVIVDPHGAEIRYSHLSSVDPMLKIGDRIRKGREIAQVGNTGNVFSTSGGDGTHLDIRIKKDGKYIDPFSYYS